MPGARTALILLLTINLFNYIDRYVLASALPAIKKELLTPDDPNTQTKEGALALAFMLSYMILAPLFGWLGDRWSRWWLIGLGVILWSVASGASGLAATFWVLLATRCFVGVGEAAYGPVAPTVISDLYPERIRGRVLSWFYMAIPVGSALGFAWGGQMAAHSLGWRWAFYLVVPPGLLLGLLCFFMPEPARGQADLLAHGSKPRPATIKDYRILFRIKSYVLDTLGMTAMTFAVGGIAYWMPTYIHEYRHVGDIDEVSQRFGAIVVVSGLVGTLLGGIAGDRLRGRFPGSYFLVSGAGMLAAFPLFLAVLYTPFPWAWIFLFLSCFCLFFNTGPSNTILANVTHPAIRATGFAANIFIIHALGDAVSPVIIGRIADSTGAPGNPNMDAGFLTVSIMILVGGILWIWGARYLERDTEIAPKLLDAS
jgi:MFS family permease